MQQFTPCANHQLVMSGSSVSQTLTAPGVGASAAYVYNGGTVPIAMRWGVGTQTAVAATDFTVAPGAYFIIGKGVADTFAAIGASGTLYLSPGEGQ